MTTQTKKWALALALSAGLNFFLLGVLSVHCFRRGPAHAGHEPTPERHALGDEQAGPALLREMVSILGGPRDPRVQKAWGARREDMTTFRREIRDARRQVRSALAREPFDKAALEKSLEQLHEASSRAQARSQSVVVALALELTPQERKRLLARKRAPSERAPLPPTHPQ